MTSRSSDLLREVYCNVPDAVIAVRLHRSGSCQAYAGRGYDGKPWITDTQCEFGNLGAMFAGARAFPDIAAGAA